jgi:cytoskeletal protein RodZ
MTLGTLLRDARESASLSIESLSESTSIRIGLLTQMESNNFVNCGGDTYARGHLRKIAERVGVDPQIFIEAYNSEHSSEHRAIQDLLAENNVMQVPREEKKISWKVPAGVSVVILVVLGLGQIIISNQSSTPSPTSTPVASSSTSASAQPSTEVATPTAEASPTSSDAKEPITLAIAAVRGNSYIDIVVDGEHVAKGSFFQGDIKSFTGNTAISIYLSNPAGLDLTLNGKLLAPLGGQNEEVRRTFR